MKPKKIPIDSHDWIDYRGNVFIIEYNSNGNFGNYQYDGTLCKQGCVEGFIFKSFKTKNKWFNPNWWYKKTYWATDTAKLYFDTGRIKHNDNTFINRTAFKKLCVEANKYARPCDKILNSILRELKDQTGIKFELEFEDTSYGLYWFEAYIPIRYNDNSYLLTWQNCD